MPVKPLAILWLLALLAMPCLLTFMRSTQVSAFGCGDVDNCMDCEDSTLCRWCAGSCYYTWNAPCSVGYQCDCTPPYSTGMKLKIKGNEDICVGVKDPDAYGARFLATMPCEWHSWWQHWRYDSSTGYIHNANGWCVTVNGDLSGKSHHVKVAGCSGLDKQRWTYYCHNNRWAIRSNFNLALDAPASPDSDLLQLDKQADASGGTAWISAWAPDPQPPPSPTPSPSSSSSTGSAPPSPTPAPSHVTVSLPYCTGSACDGMQRYSCGAETACCAPNLGLKNNNGVCYCYDFMRDQRVMQQCDVPITYKWTPLQWSACTGECGIDKGTQTAPDPQCQGYYDDGSGQKQYGSPVDISNCGGAANMPETSRHCTVPASICPDPSPSPGPGPSPAPGPSPSPSPTPSPSPHTDDSDSLSTFVIIGIVLGCIFALVGLVIAAAWFWRRHQESKQELQSDRMIPLNLAVSDHDTAIPDTKVDFVRQE